MTEPALEQRPEHDAKVADKAPRIEVSHIDHARGPAPDPESKQVDCRRGWSVDGVGTKLLLGFLGLLGAAVAPVVSHIKDRDELQLRTQEQEHAFQKVFIDKALTPKDLDEKQVMLRFYASVLKLGSPMQRFAEMELEETRKGIEAARKTDADKRDAERKLKDAELEHERIRKEIEKLKHSKAENGPKQVQDAQKILQAKEDAIKDERSRVEDAERRREEIVRSLLGTYISETRIE
jgi:hypothetical protein